jgi:hypothetical protein
LFSTRCYVAGVGRLGIVVLAVVALVSATAAYAGDPGYSNWHGHVRPAAPLPRSNHPGSAGGDVSSRVRPGSRRKLSKRCITRRRVRTCRYYSRGRLVKVCTKRPRHKQHCRRFHSTTAPGPASSRSVLYARLNSGYTNPLLPPVVRFYKDNDGWCSGTLVLRGIVLTAAHCLFANRTDGHGSYGYYPASSMVVVPGNTIDSAGRSKAPYGVWQVQQVYVPQRWADEDGGVDWGIAVIAPDGSGHYPGDYTGTYPAYWGAHFPYRSRIFRVGYPYSGPFRGASWFYGHGQYFCDNRWDGENGNDNAYTASSYNLLTKPCEMNGGSSGGPVFVQFSDGTWGIIGVNNRGLDGDNGFGLYGVSMWLDDRFGAFWNAVIGGLNGSTYRRNGTTHGRAGLVATAAPLTPAISTSAGWPSGSGPAQRAAPGPPAIRNVLAQLVFRG